MKIYNTLSRRVEEVVPITPQTILMYTCGPTVYRNIHVGNLRTFTMADWLRRTLEYRDVQVTQIKNITDVGHMRVEALDRGEDKLVAQARREGKSSAEIAAFYTASFREDEQKLNILPAHSFPRATEHVPEMIAITQDLLAKDVAYVANGTVYFDVTRFSGYGELSGNRLAQALQGLRDEQNPDKRHPEDFPLWKQAEPGREMAWESPWGRGFPGWHIECSAMAIKYLGPHFDIHTGGVDNIFPHHEDEIAQSEAHTGQRFVNYWVHAQHLLSDGLKMAKSTGNAYTLADVEARGFDPIALRYFFTTAHYRSRINFTFTALQSAQTGLNRLRLALVALRERSGGVSALPADVAALEPYRAAFLVAMEDDLNLPRAMAVVWDLLRGTGRALNQAARLALLLDLDRVLGFGLERWMRGRHTSFRLGVGLLDSDAAPEQVRDLVRTREADRRDGAYTFADEIRNTIGKHGYALRDFRDGSHLLPRRPDEGLAVISRSGDVRDSSNEADTVEFSVHLVAHNSLTDLERCLQSVLRHQQERSMEVLIVDNGSTDSTLPYLRNLARQGLNATGSTKVGLQVFFADHDMGFAAGRNATLRAARGRYNVSIDTSMELAGDIWTPLEQLLTDQTIGVVGPYGLVTNDLKEFQEDDGPEVDAVEGYLMAFRRNLYTEVGPAEEKFRFYRLMDIYLSFMFKTSGYRVVRSAELASCLVKHPHREWYSLSEEERAAKSKHNYDLFRRRWHHGESLLTANFVEADRWFGHDHAHHVGGIRAHTAEELPPPGQAHAHDHRHWPDHSQSHPHYHQTAPVGGRS